MYKGSDAAAVMRSTCETDSSSSLSKYCIKFCKIIHICTIFVLKCVEHFLVSIILYVHCLFMLLSLLPVLQIFTAQSVLKDREFECGQLKEQNVQLELMLTDLRQQLQDKIGAMNETSSEEISELHVELAKLNEEKVTVTDRPVTATALVMLIL